MVILGWLIGLCCSPVQAADSREIGSLTVLADSHLALPLTQIAALFAKENMITVSSSFGIPDKQEKHIEDGEAADLFISGNPGLITELRTKGMVDFRSIARVASNKDTHFTAVVVAGDNMNAGRSFLAFLKSDEARAILRKDGFSAP